MTIDQMVARVWLMLDKALLLLALTMIGAVLLWQLGRWSARQAGRGAAALTAVMDATVQRRDLSETLGRLLQSVADELQAMNGALFLSDAREGWTLVHTVGLADVAPLTLLPADDALVQSASEASNPVVVAQVHDPLIPWAALAHDLSVVRFGVARPGRRLGLIALGWSSLNRARAERETLSVIARYAGKVLAEFEAITQRAQDVRVLGLELQRREALTRAAAHDVLNALSAACEALGESPADATGVLALTQLRLVGGMLTDLRDPDRTLERQPVSVEALVEMASGLMALHRADLPVAFEVEVAPALPDVLGDRVELVRVLDNLLTNAVRHNIDAPAVRVWLQVRSVMDGVQFEVGDDGAGFSAEALSQAFTFGLSTDSAGRVRGSGIGLWSCQRIVAAHGGHIWIESQAGHGARVCFVLPAIEPCVEAT